jgi:hypothetical protein
MKRAAGVILTFLLALPVVDLPPGSGMTNRTPWSHFSSMVARFIESLGHPWVPAIPQFCALCAGYLSYGANGYVAGSSSPTNVPFSQVLRQTG